MMHRLFVLLVSLSAALGLLASCSNATSSEGVRAKTAPKGSAPAASAAAAAKPAEPEPAEPEPKAPGSSMPRLSGEHHEVFSLVDNRVLAHLIREEGLFIAMGHPGLAKHLNFNRPWSTWKLRQREDGRPVALASRTVSWLRFPLTRALSGKDAHLLLHLKSPKRQGLRLKLNGRALRTARLDKGWQTVNLKVPARATRAGENALELSWGVTGRLSGRRCSAAVQWLYLGPGQPEAVAQVGPVDDAGRLVLPARGGLAYYIHPYPETRLRLRFKAQERATRCEITTRLLTAGGPPALERRAETRLPPGEVAETFVDLAPIAGRVARLELTAGGERCDKLALLEAALVRPGPAPRVKRGPRPKNVVFWLIDNARADRYRIYNPETRVKTPIIDALARTGTVFERAYIQGTESRVSHATLWTGQYPKQHRFVAPKAKLNLGWVTLPEAVRKGGLYTAAWIANGFVSRFWGFGEGWDQFRNTLHRGGGLNAKRLADHSVRFIQDRGDRPFYLYVGTIDPHVSWRGRQPWLDQYHPEPYRGPYRKNVYGKDVEKIATGARKVSPADRKRIVAIYDSTVSYNDHHLGRLLEALEQKGVRDRTMIVITADHGEELWDFGRIGHGHSLRHSLVAVPYIIHYPPLFGSGVRVKVGVDVASVMPTILDAIGAPIPDTVQAESVLPLAHGVGAGYPRPSIATQYELAHTIRLERYKLWIGGKGDVRLFDLESRAKERQEIATKAPLATRWLTDALSTFMVYQRGWRSLRWGVASNHRAALAEDLEAGRFRPIRPQPGTPR